MVDSQVPLSGWLREFQVLEDISPWKVKTDNSILESVAEAFERHPILEPLYFRLLEVLKDFPPSEKYFVPPQISLGSNTIWVTITERHLRLRMKAEYRKLERVCWVTGLEVLEERKQRP